LVPEDSHKQNGILAALGASNLEELRPSLEVNELVRGGVLYEAGNPVEHIYFPPNSVVSLVAVMRDGRVAETGTIGREGFTGSETILGTDDTANSRCLVQVTGGASKLPLSTLRAFLEEGRNARQLLMTYTRALFAQVLQSAPARTTLRAMAANDARPCERGHLRADTRVPGRDAECAARERQHGQ
jgi:hypothetical protein